jgi:hypothetical protein
MSDRRDDWRKVGLTSATHEEVDTELCHTFCAAKAPVIVWP